MSNNLDDRWLWYIDDAPVQALLKAEGDIGTMKMRAASSPALVRAISAHLEGRTAEAVQQLRSAIEEGETQPDLFLMLGQILFESKGFEEAASTFRKLTELDSSHPSAWYNLGVCYEKLSRWPEASAAFARIAGQGRPEAWLGQGLASLHQRKAEEAAEAFGKYLALEPEHESALFGRAVALQMLRRFDEAAAIYEGFLTAGEPNAELLTNLLALAVARKDNDALVRVAADLGKARPGSRQAGEARAYAAIVAGQWEVAIREFDQISSTEPLSDDWAYAKAYALWQCERNGEAMRAVGVLLAQRPNHAQAHILRGALLEEEGNRAEALAAYRKGAPQAPDVEAVHWNIARVAAAEGRVEVIRQSAKSILDRNRHNAEGWFASGLAALLDRKNDEAVRGFSEALRLRRDWQEAEWNLGMAALQAGDATRAWKHLNNAREAVPAPAATEPLVRAALEGGKLQEAANLLSKAEPGCVAGAVLYNLALKFHESGQFEEAEELYRHAGDQDDASADVFVNLGHVLLATGRPEEADEAWERAAAMEAA